MKILRPLLITSLFASLLGACASAPPVGPESREWLNLQKGGAAASSEPPTLSGEAADKVYQRYVDSFGRPLPEKFEREDFGGSKSGSSGGS